MTDTIDRRPRRNRHESFSPAELEQITALRAGAANILRQTPAAADDERRLTTGRRARPEASTATDRLVNFASSAAARSEALQLSTGIPQGVMPRLATAKPRQPAPRPIPRFQTRIPTTGQGETRMQPFVPLHAEHRRFFVDYDVNGHATAREDIFRAATAQFGLVKVTGDGCCAFYAVLAGLIYQAVQFPEKRALIAGALRFVGDENFAVDAAFARIQNELPYPSAKQPHALQHGKAFLRELADVIEHTPDAAVAYAQARGNDFQKAAHVIRAMGIRDFYDGRTLDLYGYTDDLLPWLAEMHIDLFNVSMDVNDPAWKPGSEPCRHMLESLRNARPDPNRMVLLNTPNHFDLLLHYNESDAAGMGSSDSE